MMASKQAPASKKRKALAGPKSQQIEIELLSERFPEVKALVIHMTYYRKGVNPVLMKRMVNVCPTDSARFNMKCAVKGCDGGGFDLTSIITDMVRKHKKARRGELACSGNNSALAADHARIAYEIGIRYK